MFGLRCLLAGLLRGSIAVPRLPTAFTSPCATADRQLSCVVSSSLAGVTRCCANHGLTFLPACRWQEVVPLERQQMGAFWLPWTNVAMLLRLLQDRGLSAESATLEKCIQQYHALAKQDSHAMSVNSQRFLDTRPMGSDALMT